MLFIVQKLAILCEVIHTIPKSNLFETLLRQGPNLFI